MSNYSSEYIKKPHEKIAYTSKQILELRKCMKDPVYFIRNYVKVQHPTKGTLPFDLYDYQVRCIKAFQENRWCIVKAGRQLGKTAVIAAYLLWFTAFQEDKYVMVASNKNAGAIDIMNRIRFAYEELPLWLKPGCISAAKHTFEFDNRSTIISSATTETTGRGRSISLLMLDELAFVPPRIQQEMWASLAPTLSTGGSCIVSSTPNGDTDLFAKLWREAESGTNGFVPVEVEWDEHPERTESYRDEMIKKLGVEKWNQEYECVHGSTTITVRDKYSCEIKQMTMGELYDQLSFGPMFKSNDRYEILTPSGFQPFDGVKASTHQQSLRIKFESSEIWCTHDHVLVEEAGTQRLAKEIQPGALMNGLKVISVSLVENADFFYDPINVADGHLYLSNEVVSHNCEFLSSDPLLIKSSVLLDMKDEPPLFVDKGFAFWAEPQPNKTYVVGVDVAEGVEKDFSTIEVVDLDTMEQVAEFRNNKVKEGQLYDAIKWILTKLQSVADPRTGKRAHVLWSFENNSAGAALGTLYYADEKFPQEPELINGAKDGGRLGMRTTNPAKIEAARHLKNLLEKRNGKGLTIKSKPLITELKNYISTGASWAAKHGATDDLISAMLIVVRVIRYVSEYEPEVFEKLYRNDEDYLDEMSNEYEDPLPFILP